MKNPVSTVLGLCLVPIAVYSALEWYFHGGFLFSSNEDPFLYRLVPQLSRLPGGREWMVAIPRVCYFTRLPGWLPTILAGMPAMLLLIASGKSPDRNAVSISEQAKIDAPPSPGR